MTYLLIALAALALGPVVLNGLRERPALADALDGFVVVSITGLVFLHFVPEAEARRRVGIVRERPAPARIPIGVPGLLVVEEDDPVA